MELTDARWRKSSRSTATGGNCVEVTPAWRKSSRSTSTGGNCLEAAVDWRKSSRSSPNGGDCVEAAPGPAVAVRDSKDPDGPALAVGRRQWEALTAAIRSGRI